MHLNLLQKSKDDICIIKRGYFLENLSPDTMKLLGSTKTKLTNKKENGKNVPHLEITGLVLVHCNIINNNCQQHLRILYTFFPNK